MVISITRKCDRGKNPFNTISKKELLLYLEPKIGKKLTNKNKTYLCNLWKSLQGDDNQNITDLTSGYAILIHKTNVGSGVTTVNSSNGSIIGISTNFNSNNLLLLIVNLIAILI